MALLGLNQVRMAYGGPWLLDGVTLQIERNERISLVGRNGEGKSTLLRLLTGEEQPDGGEVVRQAGVRVGFLPQQVPGAMPGTAAEIVAAALVGLHEEWEADQRVRLTLEQLGMDPDARFTPLSGGQKRRVLLARALVTEPDVLVLDEPTNHLDLASIDWLEQFLLRYSGSLVFVTHDRAFLRRLATRIVELDRGQLSSWSCSYDRYLALRQEQLEGEEKQRALFDKKLAQEEAWIRQGIKARRTRNEGRVRALEQLRRERQARREQAGRVQVAAQHAATGGQKVLVAENVGFAWDGKPVFRGLNTRILRGDKVGIIGPNGCGKSTLLQVLLGRLVPGEGKVEQGTGLEIAYFDQHREALDEDRSVAENVAGESTHVVLNGQRRHVLSYLEDFLFAPDRSRTLVKALSGGERNRLLLARLFTKPANLLVLDEPTNDLDLETLELLENLLVEFPGTILLVSHDRDFLNEVVTSTLVFGEGGRVEEYVGGYDDWLDQRGAVAVESAVVSERVGLGAARPVAATAAGGGKKLSNKEREELGALPARIEALEAESEGLAARMQDPAFYRGAADAVAAATARMAVLPTELEAAYARWHVLEERAGGSG
jgi:ATP-binding cassette subfamily F protein uup